MIYCITDDHPVSLREALEEKPPRYERIDTAYADLAVRSLDGWSNLEAANLADEVKIVYDTRGAYVGKLSTPTAAEAFGLAEHDVNKVAEVSEQYKAGHDFMSRGGWAGEIARKRAHEAEGCVCIRALGTGSCTCSGCRGPNSKYGRQDWHASDMETGVPPKKREPRPTNAALEAMATKDQFRGYHSKLSLTRDIFEMERMVKEVATVIDSRPTIWDDPFVAYLKTHNARIDRLRCPPCSYFNLGLCEYERVHTHPTRGQAHGAGKPFVGERAHICAVCFAQKMTSPHRVTRCPIVRELDNVLLREWKVANSI